MSHHRKELHGPEKGGYIDIEDTAYGVSIDISGKATVYIDMWEFREGRDGVPLVILDAGSDSVTARLNRDNIIISRERAIAEVEDERATEN